MMRIVRLALGHARRRRAMSVAALALPAVMAGAIVTLTGDATRRADGLLGELRDTKSRSVVLRAGNSDKRISPTIARALASMPGVELAIAFPSAQSVTAPGLHDPAASVGYVSVDTLAGTLPVRLTAGRRPGVDEVVVSAGARRSLRMTEPLATGVVTNDGVLPVVGTFELADRGAISELLANAIIGPRRSAADSYTTLAMLVREPADVRVVADATSRLIPDREGITLDYEPRAANIEQLVAGAGTRNVASLALAVVLTGALIQIASSLLNSLLQRRENARRRALGFTRTEIVLLGMVEAGLLSGVGAAIGTTFAALRLAHESAPVRAEQLAATIGFLLLLAVVSSIPGGANAALQDPARILRVP